MGTIHVPSNQKQTALPISYRVRFLGEEIHRLILKLSKVTEIIFVYYTANEYRQTTDELMIKVLFLHKDTCKVIIG